MQTIKRAVIEFQGQQFEVCIDGNKTIILDANNVQVPNMKEFLRNVFSSWQIAPVSNDTTQALAGKLINHINKVPSKSNRSTSVRKSVIPPSVGSVILQNRLLPKDVQSKYIIPCCGRKISEATLLQLVQPFDTLSFDNELSGYRDEIMAIYIANGKEINFNLSAPAHKLYSKGNLYNSANSFTWNNGQAEQVYIISALFGIIKATDKIPLYNLSMTDNINGFNPKIFWQGKLDSIIEHLTNNFPVVDLLSQNYKDAIQHSQQFLIDAGMVWTDKYGRHRGRWLWERLNT